MTTIAAPIQLRHGTAAQWTTANPVLLAGEAGLEGDTGRWKFGDGTLAWSALAYVGVSGAIPISQVTGLQAALDANIAIAKVTGLQTALDAKLTQTQGDARYVLQTGVPPGTIVYQNNFDAETTGALPTGWTSDTGTWQVTPTNAVSGKAFGSSVNVDGDTARYTAMSAVADMILRYDYKVVDATYFYSSVSPMVRAVDATNYYLWVIRAAVGAPAGMSSSLIAGLYKVIAGVYTQIGSDSASQAGVVNGDIIRVEAQVVGTAHSIKLWRNAEAKPAAATASQTDGSITTASVAGLYNSHANFGPAMAADNVIISVP